LARWSEVNHKLEALSVRRGPVPYLVATGLVLISFLARLAIDPWIGDRGPLMPFVAAVVISAGMYGVGPGLLAIFLSAVLAAFAFIDPAGPGGISTEQMVHIVVFLVTGAAMTWFAAHLRETRNRADRLEVELQQAQANAAMGTMAGTLAHELNQPLAAAANYVAACQQLAAGPTQSPQSMAKGLQQAEAQIQRVGEIIRHARSLVKNVPLERETASLRRMFRRAIEVVEAGEAGKKVSFEVDVRPDAEWADVNSVQIEQVLLNLLRNACQSTQSAGRPKVSLKATSTDRGQLIEVRDNGAGIALDRLTSLFSATKSSTNGLGIGLSISRTIVEAHGGNIWAQNNPDGGASFFTLLPGAKPTP